MVREELIVSTLGTRSGKARINGTRITVEDIVQWLPEYIDLDRLMDEYPSVTHEGFEQVVDYLLLTVKQIDKRVIKQLEFEKGEEPAG